MEKTRFVIYTNVDDEGALSAKGTSRIYLREIVEDNGVWVDDPEDAQKFHSEEYAKWRIDNQLCGDPCMKIAELKISVREVSKFEKMMGMTEDEAAEWLARAKADIYGATDEEACARIAQSIMSDIQEMMDIRPGNLELPRQRLNLAKWVLSPVAYKSVLNK